jgi:hypothetical protein
MSEFTDFGEEKILSGWFRTLAAYKPTGIYFGLWTTTLVDASTGSSGTEASGGSYARVQVTQLDANWNAPGTSGLIDNVNDITFATATASWGTITDVGICDASSAGNMLMYTALDVSKLVSNGDTFKFAAGALDIIVA